MDNLEFIIKFNGAEYKFDSGVKVYIFHTGMYNDMHIKYSIKTLLKYTDFVTSCYLSDSNRTPIGELADYIAQNWKRVKNKDRYAVLDEFYENGDY